MRNRYVLLADLPLIAVAAYIAFALRFDWLFQYDRADFVLFLTGALLVKPPIFALFGLYRRYWRSASTPDLIAIALATTSATLFLTVIFGVGRALDWFVGVSRSVLAIDWLLTLVVVGGLRLSIRVIGDERERTAKKGHPGLTKRVLVVGAGEAGRLVVREMHRNPQLALRPVGFLDDSPAKAGKIIAGVRVLGTIAELDRVLRAYSITEVFIAMPTADGAVVRSAALACQGAGVSSRVLPGVYELLDGKVSVSRLRQVEISDLLRRRQVTGMPEAASYVAGKPVLVTGAGGSIGAELCRQAAHAHPRQLVMLGHGENSIFEAHNRLTATFPDLSVVPVIADIRDAGRLERIFLQYQPAVVFHAAAHKHVPLMEANPEEAITNNVLGTANLLRAAEKAGTHRLVMISSDKAVAPSTVMGASKRLAESLVHEAALRAGSAFSVVRFGNVLGSRGSVVPLFKAQIERGGPVTVTHPEMTRFFMTIPEAVHLVLQAGGISTGGELFVLNMGDPVRISDLASDLIRLSGFDEHEIPIVYCGIRPGEKLEEKLWEEGARIERTTHADVWRVHEPSEVNVSRQPSLLAALDDAAKRNDPLEILALLAASIPTFVPAGPRSSAPGVLSHTGKTHGS